MLASYAVPAPTAAVQMFDVVTEALDESGVKRAASFCDGMNAVVTLQASDALIARGWPAVIEVLTSKEATDYAEAAARRLGLNDPRPQLFDAPYAVDENGQIITIGVKGQKIAAYRIEIRLVAGGR